MLVTPTEREVVSLFPRFRIMAVSMQRLQIGRARIAAITVDVIHLDTVVMLEEQPAGATTAVLPFEHLGQSRADARMSPLSCAPVHPVAIVWTAMAHDLDMPSDGHLTMCVEMHGLRACGRRGKGPTGVEPVPISIQ